MAAKNLHVRKNDMVMIIAGKEKGKSGKVLHVFPSKGRLTVENLNMVKRHKRATRAGAESGIIEKEAAIDASNVMLLCGACNKPVRTGTRLLEDGSKARYCKKCNEIVDK
jgi:large subunit ribosomal protein L24